MSEPVDHPVSTRRDRATAQNCNKAPAAAELNRRAVVAGAGIAAVTAVLPGCATGDRSAASPGTRLGPASGVPVGAGTVFADHEVVVTQPMPGNFRSFSAICTHQGCTVAEVSTEAIICPCHGSKFDITDGSVIRGPAQQPLPRRPVTVEATSTGQSTVVLAAAVT
jgi:nitrite reductase/ring-hydroxylating ferredoxin subunit